MRTLTLLTLAVLLLAGCTQTDDGTTEETTAATTTAGGGTTATTATTPPPAEPLGLTLEPPAATRNATVAVNGSLALDSVLTLRVLDDGNVSFESELAAHGDWSAALPLPPGRSLLNVTARGDGVTEWAEAELVRLQNATITVEYGVYSSNEDREDVVWYDPEGNQSDPFYAQHDGAAPAAGDRPVVHDAMMAWQDRHGVEVAYGYHEEFGASVEKIEGAGTPVSSSAPPWWTYSVNGEPASQGITFQPVAPGDVIAWRLSSGE